VNNTVKITELNTIYTKGTEALIRELGPVGMVRYLEQYDNGGTGDYTKEKYEQPELSIDEIVSMQ
jgi:hypothetical protein